MPRIACSTLLHFDANPKCVKLCYAIWCTFCHIFSTLIISPLLFAIEWPWHQWFSMLFRWPNTRCVALSEGLFGSAHCSVLNAHVSTGIGVVHIHIRYVCVLCVAYSAQSSRTMCQRLKVMRCLMRYLECMAQCIYVKMCLPFDEYLRRRRRRRWWWPQYNTTTKEMLLLLLLSSKAFIFILTDTEQLTTLSRKAQDERALA